ncbi:MAG TPA: hypothetical protein VFZ66_30040 [Herpetosiphonaceae bacterium]
MELALLQRQLLGLIKATYQPTEADEPYIQMVAQSPQLELVSEIARWWQTFGIIRACPLTSTLLQQRGSFEPTAHAFLGSRDVSPFVDRLGLTFLEAMSQHDDALIAAVARFELALLRVKGGSPATYTVEWRHEPYAVLYSLLQKQPLDESGIQGHYQTLVSGQIPGLFLVAAREE